MGLLHGTWLHPLSQPTTNQPDITKDSLFEDKYKTQSINDVQYNTLDHCHNILAQKATW